MTTQLYISGVEAVLPQNFAVTVKRENSFFTKSGEYTYDVTLRLDNPVNSALWGFLTRFNKIDELSTNRPATLIADGRVYCRGTEVITRWTDETVTIQIVSGESELNYFIGQDLKIEDLDLGEASELNSCYTPVRTPSGEVFNQWVYTPGSTSSGYGASGTAATGTFTNGNPVPQPYLCPLIEAIIKALGYNQESSGVNQLRDTQFKNLFLVNTIHTTQLAKMFTGWTVKELLEEVEKLTGAVFVTNNLEKTCDVLIKTRYYQEASQLTIRNVTDAYETECVDEEGREAEFSSCDVAYELPDHRWANLMKLPEDLKSQVTFRDYDDFDTLIRSLKSASSELKERVVFRDTSTGRCYIRAGRSVEGAAALEGMTASYYYALEVDQFANLDRDERTATMEMKITPAPMTRLWASGGEIIDLGSKEAYAIWDEYNDDSGDDSDTEDEDEQPSLETLIREYSSEQSETVDIYCAFCKGDLSVFNTPMAYTDAYHARIQQQLYDLHNFDPGEPEGSLRLEDLDTGYFQGSYLIDTRRAVTIETYDPNVIDPRQVYVVRNRRFVCRDVEEVITAEGRQPRWRGTFYPIRITDESLEHRWVLTHGVWDDHAAWLDDGRWIDDYDGADL